MMNRNGSSTSPCSTPVVIAKGSILVLEGKPGMLTGRIKHE